MPNFGWTAAPYKAPAATPGVPLTGLEAGVLAGFSATPWGSPDIITDPAMARGAFTGPGSGWNAQVNITSIARVVQPAGGPGGDWALTITVPYTAYASIICTGLIPISGAVLANLAAGAGGSAVYSFWDLWVQSSVALSGTNGGSFDFGYYDKDGNFLAQSDNAIGLAANAAANTWAHVAGLSGNVQDSTYTGGIAARDQIVNAAYVRGALSWDNATGGPVTVTLAAAHLSRPSLTTGVGLQLQLSPGTYDAQGQLQAYPGGTYTLNAADPSNPRIDLFAWNWLLQQVVYVAGVPGVGPAAPALPDFCAPLWHVTVPAGATGLTWGDLGDVRARAAIYIGPNANAHINGAVISPAGAITPGGDSTLGGHTELTVLDFGAVAAGVSGTATAAGTDFFPGADVQELLGQVSAAGTYTLEVTGTNAAVVDTYAVLWDATAGAAVASGQVTLAPASAGALVTGTAAVANASLVAGHRYQLTFWTANAADAATVYAARLKLTL